MPRKRSPTPELARKRGRIACVSCRQAKVKCNFTSIPCARCTKLSIDCSVDPGYKRTNKRDKVHELEDNVQELRNLIEQQQNHDHEDTETVKLHFSGVEGENAVAQPTNGNTTRSNSVNQVSHEVLPSSRVRSIGNGDDVYSLGPVSLNGFEVDSLFSVYFRKYHRNLPILDPAKSPKTYHELCSPLFWTIVSVAFRSYPQDDGRLQLLIPVLCTHLWSEFGSSKKNSVGVDASSVYEIQALVLLSTWPLPNVRLWSDRSLIQSNLAISAAMHIGLHRPGFDFEYARNLPSLDETVFQERSSTWIACYCLCVSLSLQDGHAPLVPAIDWLVNKVTYPVPQVVIPVELRHHAILEKQAHDAFQVFLQMHENPAAIAQEPTFFSHLKAFEAKFEATHKEYQTQMSLVNQIRSRGNILLLQMLYFLADQTLKQTRAGLMRAYKTSNRIISTLMADDNINEVLTSAPYIILRIILRAAFTLQRLYFSSFNDAIDHITCKILFDSSTMLIRQMSISEDSQAKRVIDALKMTWKHMEKDPTLLQQNPTLRIRSRLGASMQYDCLFYYRDAVVKASDRQKGQVLGASSAIPAVTTNVVTPTRSSFEVGFGEAWETPSLENFLETDFSWLDDLVTAGPFPGA